MRKGSTKRYTVLAAIAATAIAATPLVMGAGNALATSDHRDAVVTSVAVTPVEIAPVAAPDQVCTRKVRVVYSGYGDRPSSCIELR